MNTVKLYDLEQGQKFRLLGSQVPPDARMPRSDEVITFGHIDGMYSFCRDSNGEVVHPVAWSNVEIVE